MAAEQLSSFGAQLRRYREAAGLSQEDLAERAGLTTSAIGALERGERRRPYPHTVQLLATALNLDETQRTSLIAAVPRRPVGTFSGAPSAAVVQPPPSGRSDRGRELPLASDDHPTAALLRSPQLDCGRAQSSFVGREGELAVLRARLAEASAGQGSVVMMVGEAGIGKTRLAREFSVEAVAHGAVLFWGCCFEGDWQPPYGPWVEAFGAYVRASDPENVRRILGPGASPIARLVPEVHLVLRGVPVPSPLSPDEERFRLYDAAIRFLLAVSTEQPVLLVLDDLHWADPDSLRLLRHLARFVGQARILVVGAYRDPEFGLNDEHPLIGTLSVLRREGDYERLAIRGFSRDEVGEYLAQTAGRNLPQALVRVIEEETGGNPFYAREVFRHLMEEAKVLQRDGKWLADLGTRGLGIPEGVRQVVGRRVARLSAQTSGLLRLAAGFSGGFGFEVLQALSELSEQALLDCIDEALQAGLIRASGQVSARYEFAHAIVRHTLYEGLNPDRRARLHRRIALALERVRGDGGAEDAELAWQYHASAALPGAEKGIPYALRAAGQARAAYAHERAATFLRMARELAAGCRVEEKADILRQLAIAEAEAVELDRAQHSVGEALDAMSAAGVEPRAHAEFLAVVARALKDGGATSPVWEPLVERGLALVGDARDLLWARLALLRDRFEYLQSGPIGGAQWLGFDPQAVAVARAEGDEEDYARTLDPLDCRTREETRDVLALAHKWQRPAAVMRALDVAGRDLLYRSSAYREGRAVYEELLAVSERFGSIPSQGEALTHIATSQMLEGDLLLGRESMRRAQEVIDRLGTAHRMYRFVAISRAIFVAYLLDGDWATLASEAREYATSEVARRSSIGMLAAAMAAISACRAGDAVEAGALLGYLSPIVGRRLLTAYAQNIAVVFAVVAAWELEATEQAATYRDLVLQLLEAGICYNCFGPLELHVARMSSLLGDFAEAQAYFERARRRLAEQEATYLRPILDYDQACSLIRASTCDHGRVIDLLKAALEGFRAHRMHGWAARALERREELADSAC